MKSDRDINDRGHTDPLRGPKGDMAFLKSNYQAMSVGSFFRTVKARFSPAQIQAGAKKAGWAVDIREEGPWLRVQVTKRLPPEKVMKKQNVYTGAGKVYPSPAENV